MPLNKNIIFVYDFETWDANPNTCEVVQVAALAIEPRKLQVMDGSEFVSYMKPLDIKNFSQKAIDINKITEDKVADAPDRRIVWERFVDHINKFNHKKGNIFTAPVQAGMNINRFDAFIIDRLAREYGNVNKDGEPNLFYPMRSYDLKELLFFWFESVDVLPNLKMDAARPFFGLTTEGAHDALTDVRQTAELLIRFLNFHRKICGDGERFRQQCLKK